MSKFRLVRNGALAVGAILGVLLLTGTANASVLVYSASNVNVRVTGGEALALNNCINDAQDGIIQTQINSCYQVASAGNIVQLDYVSIWVQSNGFPSYLLFSRSNVTVEISGGLAVAANNCINDAQDGIIQTQINSCLQYSQAGNIVALYGVSVAVYQ